MKSIVRSLIAMVLLWGLLERMAIATTYEFRFDPPSAEAQAASLPKVVESSSLTINGVRMNTFNTTFENPNEMTVLSFRAKALRSKIKAEYLKKFDLYAMPNGNVFVPKGWKLVSANLGKDESLSYTFRPLSGGGYLSFSSISSCKNCAVREASLFFKQAVSDAPSHKVSPYTNANFPLSVVTLKPTLVAYGTEHQTKRIEGVAYYNLNAPQPFWKVEVGLAPEFIGLANPLLNQFITIYE